MTLKDLYTTQILPCTACEISKLTGNCEKNIWGGYEDNVDFFWIGQNPAYVDKQKKQDWENGKFSRTFPPRDNSSKKVDEFTQFLWEQNIYQRSFFTNVVKCATLENREPTPEETVRCASFLMKEIELVKPKKVIPLGRYAQFTVGKIFNTFHCTLPIHPLYHPSYVYNRNRILIPEYQQRILEIVKT